ncbi:MAG: starch-binding protein [Muribaculaceae bacterium]|nr:starch-binding protein [Muribaculaceae bacterium]
MKFIKNSLTLLAVCACAANTGAANYAWPERFEGVMLQGFAWDSYSGVNNTKWTSLTKLSDELSKNFKVIWVPNSAKAASNPGMGYDPVYWFTNHNTSFGTETQLREMIKTFKAKGTDIIEDVVINHRSGVSNWTNFPAETWNGVTYQLGPQHICSNDEVAWATGQAKPTGAPDTGENFDGSRDLDHTNSEVQRNCKNYCKFLIDDLGYAGFRYDMVKGYSGYYNKIYNEYSHPKYSVGEYWDGNYDAVASWIEATGRQSAAFDFPCKYAINEAFHSGDLTKLVWKANGTTDQPAGLIHYGYPQYAVTFVDNHDTYRDGSKFNGNVVAANAFILCSPGTPCVFWPHYVDHKAEIQALIAVRNACGIHNQSQVKVLRSSRDCYMAEVTGTKGTLVVKVGGTMVSPDGYTNADIRTAGTDYCVWSHTGVISTPDDPVTPPAPSGDPFNVYYDNSSTGWPTPFVYYWPVESPAYPGVAMKKVSGNIWEYTVPAGTTGLLFNAGDGDATKTGDFTAVANHLYTHAADKGVYQGGGNTPVPPVNAPANLYLIGNVNGMDWASARGLVQDNKSGNVYTWTAVTLHDSGDGYAYFSFLSQLDNKDGDWDLANKADRYGAVSNAEYLSLAASIHRFAPGPEAMACNAWKVTPGIYSVTADLDKMKVSLSTSTGVEVFPIDIVKAPVYFNLQGVRVDNPKSGIYIRVHDGKSSKVVIR